MKSSEYISCSRCGEEITADSDFCPHCGTLFSKAAALMCDSHGASPAIGICIICRKLSCGQCGKDVKGRFLCREHGEVEVQQDWARIFQSSDINDSELVKSFLESNGFTVLTQNFAPVGFVWDGGGDSSLSRSNISKPAKILVPIPEYLKAEAAIREWRSGAIETPDEP